MTKGQTNRCIIMFLRVPEKGKVKTRISKDLPENEVLAIYKMMILDVLHSARKTNHPILIYFYPDHKNLTLQDWLGAGFEYFPQKGNNLGKKMENAFADAFCKGYDSAVLTGTDCPDITPQIFEDALDGLDKYASVIGPALDGGYYLIGFNKKTFIKDVFSQIPWGRDNVFQLTKERLMKNQVYPFILPKMRDMDTLEDLKHFKAAHSKNRSFHSHTIQLLQTIHL